MSQTVKIKFEIEIFTCQRKYKVTHLPTYVLPDGAVISLASHFNYLVHTMNSRKIYFKIFLIRHNIKSKEVYLVESNKPNAKIGNLNPSTSA